MALVIGLMAALTISSVPAHADHAGYFHWQRKGGSSTSRPAVTFVDHTPARWPVRAAVTEWNRAPNIDSLYSWQTCPTSAQYCVHVYEYYEQSGVFGYYAPKPVPTTSAGHVAGNITVHFNRHHARNSGRDRSTICHELGHVLGLAHQYVADSCMWGNAERFPLYPNQHDFDQLRDIYAHERP